LILEGILITFTEHNITKNSQKRLPAGIHDIKL